MPNAIVFSGLRNCLFAAADFAEMTTIHPPGKMAIREVAAVPADFPVIAAAYPLGGAAVREAAAICAGVIRIT